MNHELDGTRRYRKFLAAGRVARRHLSSGLPPAFFLTDPTRVPDPLPVVGNLPRGWGVILRHFGMGDQIALAEPLSKLCRRRGLILLIANDPELAIQVRADGVHWPERSLGKARRWVGRFEITTGAAHSRSSVRKAERSGCDAALLSTVFASKSPSASKPLGPVKFRALSRSANLPVYGLGGVNSDNAGCIAPFGGIASIGGIVEAFSRT